MRQTTLIDTILSVLVLVVILLNTACSTPLVQTPSPVQPGETSAPLPMEPTVAPTSPAAESPVSRLRIKNAGAHDLKNLVVMFPESRIVFVDVAAGATSEYQDAPRGVYNYSAYEYLSGGETALQYVIDWVGESPRPGQSYTYVLDYDPDREGLKIELVEVLADAN